MTVNEAAAVLGLTPGTVRDQIRNGRLQAVRRGRDWWITPAAVERYRLVSLGRPGRAADPAEAAALLSAADRDALASHACGICGAALLLVETGPHYREAHGPDALPVFIPRTPTA